jgi:hypothetical protein
VLDCEAILVDTTFVDPTEDTLSLSGKLSSSILSSTLDT